MKGREKSHEREREKGIGKVSSRGQDSRRVRTEQGGCQWEKQNTGEERSQERA